jgi:hypothetical protein
LAILGALTSAVAEPVVAGLQPGRDPATPVVSRAEPDGWSALGLPDVEDCPGVGAGVGPRPLGTRLPLGSFVPGVPTFDGKLKD